MGFLKKKKKSFDLFSKDFYIDNQGDIFCMFLVLITLTQYVGFLKVHTNQFVWVQYKIDNNQSDSLQVAKTLYKIGPKDYSILFSATILFLVYLCAMEEYIIEKYLPRLKLSFAKSYECRLSIFCLPYLIFSLIYMGYALVDNRINERIHTIFSEVSAITVHYKILMILSMGFWLAMFIKLFTSRPKAIDIHWNAFTYIIYFFLSYDLYLIGLFNYALIVIYLHSLVSFCQNFVFLTSVIPAISVLQSIAKQINLFVTFISSTIGVAISVYFFKTVLLGLNIKKINYALIPKLSVSMFVCGLFILHLVNLLSSYFKSKPKKSTKPADDQKLTAQKPKNKNPVVENPIATTIEHKASKNKQKKKN